MAADAAFTSEAPVEEQPPGRWSWLRVLLIGLAIWLIAVVQLAVTGEPNLIPFVVLWGSFLIPVTAVIFFFSHLMHRVVSHETVISGFIWGGAVGVLIAGFAESFLLGDGPFQYLGVGFIEEAAKLVALIMVARRLPRYTLHDGLVLGAAVGFGFGAMETSGYSLVSMFTGGGLSLPNLIDTEVLRGLLAPLGHGLWTGILGGVLFEEAERGRLRFTGKVFGAFVLVSLLHALWDSMRGIALVITALVSGAALAARATGLSLFRPSADQVRLFSGTEFAGMAIVAIIGVVVLVHLWRKREPFVLEAPSAAA